MNTITIELENLKFKGFHGVHKKEQEIGSFFYVNAKLTYTMETVKTLDETVNYEIIFSIIKEEMANTKELLEEVCQEIIEKSKLKFPFLEKVELTIKKASPPISYFNGKSVNVTITKEWRK